MDISWKTSGQYPGHHPEVLKGHCGVLVRVAGDGPGAEDSDETLPCFPAYSQRAFSLFRERLGNQLPYAVDVGADLPCRPLTLARVQQEEGAMEKQAWLYTPPRRRWRRWMKQFAPFPLSWDAAIQHFSTFEALWSLLECIYKSRRCAVRFTQGLFPAKTQSGCSR